MVEDPHAIAHAVYTALNNGDASVFDLLDPNIEWDTPATLPWTVPGSNGCYRGHAELADYFRHCLRAVDALGVDVADLLVVGDTAVMLGYEFGRSRKTNRSFNARCAHVLTVHAGKVTRLQGFPDTAAMAEAFS